MALPTICPECGIHNPPENRWCECGYDLDKIRHDTPSPIKRLANHSTTSPIAPASSGDHAENERQKPVMGRDSYLRRHWRGKLSLAQSYWINTFGLSFLLIL